MSSAQVTTSKRVGLFDAIRGFSVVSMVLFHLCYDLTQLYGVKLGWFCSPLEDIWRASISWTFVLIAGCMTVFTRDNLKRSAKYLLVASVIYLVTSVAAVDVPISFGIIYCMGACTLTYGVFEKAGCSPKGLPCAIACTAAFLLLLNVSRGTVGLAGFNLALPRQLYSTEWLSWLGFPGPTFASGDYYPLLPYLMLYLVGACLGDQLKSKGCPNWAQSANVAPLNYVGRHALLVYVIHQPLILVLCEIAAALG